MGVGGSKIVAFVTIRKKPPKVGSRSGHREANRVFDQSAHRGAELCRATLQCHPAPTTGSKSLPSLWTASSPSCSVEYGGRLNLDQKPWIREGGHPDPG